jgi:hypothetical protein
MRQLVGLAWPPPPTPPPSPSPPLALPPLRHHASFQHTTTQTRLPLLLLLLLLLVVAVCGRHAAQSIAPRKQHESTSCAALGLLAAQEQREWQRPGLAFCGALRCAPARAHARYTHPARRAFLLAPVYAHMPPDALTHGSPPCQPPCALGPSPARHQHETRPETSGGGRGPHRSALKQLLGARHARRTRAAARVCLWPRSRDGDVAPALARVDGVGA